MLRILFVDDEINVLDGLRRAMRVMREEWDMSFAASGVAALVTLSESHFDVVVSDMRMPGMDGRDLLFEVKRRYPQIVRFILSGYAEATSIMQVAGTAHQYLAKPCDAQTLKAALTRTRAVRTLLNDERLLRRIGAIDALPSLPSAYQQIVSCLQRPDATISDVARIIRTDIAMTVTVLKLANSAFFGAGQTFKTAERAVSFLGLNTIAGLVLAHGVFNEFTPVVGARLNLEKVWQHSMNTAAGARAIATYERWSVPRTEEVFLASVLHDLGKLVLATRPVCLAEPGQSAQLDEDLDAPDSEHAIAGAYLLGLWGFSDTLIEAVAFHHSPDKAATREFGLVGVLHVADRLAHDFDGDSKAQEMFGIESGYLESLGLENRLLEWQKMWPGIAKQDEAG